MSHNLEIKNGKASFVSARKPAWHQLGTVLDHSMTAEEALGEGGLAGWNIRKAPLQTVDPVTGEVQEVPDKFGVVRDGGAPLGVVGSAYTVMQNESLTGLLDSLIDESGAHYETAGALDKGRKVFVSMALPEHISIGGVDPVNTYLTAMTSHDGSSSTSIIVTPVRVVCQNTMSLALSQAQHQFRIRHTLRADQIVLSEARRALDLTFSYLDEFQATAEQLINTTMTQTRFEEIIDAEFGASPDAPAIAHTRAQNKTDEMARLFADSNTHKDVRNTAWAGLNALTEWFDWYSPVRSDDQASRAQRTVLDGKFKSRALELVTQ